MTHPDTLQIPRAVVEQALAALMPHKSTVLRIYTAADAAIDALQAALQPQAAADAIADAVLALAIPDGGDVSDIGMQDAANQLRATC